MQLCPRVLVKVSGSAEVYFTYATLRPRNLPGCLQGRARRVRFDQQESLAEMLAQRFKDYALGDDLKPIIDVLREAGLFT